MTKITEVEDRGATVAWSPVSSHADYLALGVKVSAFGRGTLQNAIMLNPPMLSRSLFWFWVIAAALERLFEKVHPITITSCTDYYQLSRAQTKSDNLVVAPF